MQSFALSKIKQKEDLHFFLLAVAIPGFGLIKKASLNGCFWIRFLLCERWWSSFCSALYIRRIIIFSHANHFEVFCSRTWRQLAVRSAERGIPFLTAAAARCFSAIIRFSTDSVLSTSTAQGMQ